MRISRKLWAVPFVAGALLLGEAAARPAQEARADNWNWYISPDVVYCEGCCTPGLLCCTSAQRCRVSPT